MLLSTYQHVATLPVNPADESWLNIHAIDDLIVQTITTLDKLTISAVAGSAGAGGAMLALAADRFFPGME